MEKNFELALSTRYKGRFTDNAKGRRKAEKEMAQEMKKFKVRAKAYAKKNYEMWEMLDSFRHTEQQAIEGCVEQTYKFIDNLIQK